MAMPTLNNIIPKGSLKRLSPINVPDMSSLILSFLNVGINDAGSVGDIMAPKMKPIIKGAPVIMEKKIPAPTAVMTIPMVSREAILIRYFLKIRGFILCDS